MEISPARLAALDVLRVVRRGAFADRAFERVAPSLDEADRRLAQELAYGVLRLRSRLDFVLGRLVKGGLERLSADVVDILRLGAYQLLELDRVPAYAAVSEAVEASKGAEGKGAAALTNAVLRRLSRESYDSFEFPLLEEDALGHLTTWGSHPGWLAERWMARWPIEDVGRLVEYNNKQPPVYLSVAGARVEAMETLHSAAVRAEAVAPGRSSLRVDAGSVSRALALVDAVVQDPAAAAVVDYMALDPGSEVVDLCAAPGGKASLLAARGHHVWATDIAAGRLAVLQENRERLGLSGLHVIRGDATRPPFAQARAVLLDVPCSGTGTLARHPDSRWRVQEDDIGRLVELQRQLADAAAHIVTPGGMLVYATCSLESEENEEQVEAFLHRWPEFELEAPPAGAMAGEFMKSDGSLRVLPQRHGLDGAYAARLRHRPA